MRSISNGLPRQPKKTGHFAALPFSDLPDFMSKICIRSSLGRLALDFLILNASRSGNVLGARWSELDLKRNVGTIPADRMKMEREHAVPLSRQALIVLERAKLYRCEARARALTRITRQIVSTHHTCPQLSTKANLTAAGSRRTGEPVLGYRSPP